jgi:hypothetical protein
MFVFEDQGEWAALPFLRRPVAQVEGLEECDCFDAVSAYGYPGVVTSAREHDPRADTFRRRFQDALREALRDLNVVCLFVRQNPLMSTSWLLASVAEVTTHGPTVAIDLAQPDEQQVSQFRSNHRRDIRRARREGIVVHEDTDLDRIELFRELYLKTMDRAGAAPYYFFTRQYFDGLRQHLGRHVKLFFSEQGGRAISGGMFLAAGDVVQYHLGGTATEDLKCRGAVKVLFDEVRRWGTQSGFRWLHLGGGTGAQQDSLFHFKAGFSQARFSFQTARMVLRPDVYDDLARRRRRWMSDRGYTPGASEYFPEYRRAPRLGRAA